MKKIFVFAICVLAHSFCIAAQQPVSPVAEPSTFGGYRTSQNTNNAAAQANFTELYGSVSTLTSGLANKANSSCFANATAMASCFPSLTVGGSWGNISGSITSQTDLSSALSGKESTLGNPSTSGYVLSSTTAGVRSWVPMTGGSFDQAGDYTLSGSVGFTGPVDFTGASVTGLSGTSLPTGTEGDFYRVGASGAETVTPLTPVAGQSITLPVVGDTVTINAWGDDTAYGTSWNGSTKPVSQNAVYDKIESMGSGGTTTISGLTDWPAGVTATELSYIDGATSNLQAQLNAISAGSGGTVSAITSEPYSDVACTGGKYDTVANRFYLCIDGYHTAYISGTAFNRASPVTYTLTIDGTGWDGTDLVSVGGTTYTTDGTKTGLSGSTSVTVIPNTGHTATCSGTGITGSSSPYTADMSTNRTINCTFAASAGGVETLRPIGAGTFSEYPTVVGSTYCWSAVDESTYDDADNCQSDDGYDKQTFAWQNTSASSGHTITKVRFYARISNTAVLYVNNTSLDWFIPTVVGTFETKYLDYTTKPGGGAWTSADIDNIDAGFMANNNGAWVSQAYIEVFYE